MMDDLFSRRDAIHVVSEITTTMSVCANKDECYGMKRMQKQAITELENMPSVQPDIIRCKDCKHSRFFDPCFYCYEMGGEVIVPENGFCFKAERRMNATD